MVAYVASRSPLPLIPFREDAPAFNVTNLTEHERPVLNHLTLPHVRQAGSHTSCGCGFNEGREHPEVHDDAAAARADALESSAQLARYVREHRVEQIWYLGMKIEGDGCRCDDPGLKGYAIGMPIGGLFGGLGGALIASR
jgi:hypothetical protein